MINTYVATGRLTKDVELTSTKEGKPVGKFTLAIDTAYTNQDGSKNTMFLTCLVFAKGEKGNNVHAIANNVSKGSLVGIEGRLSQRKFTRRDGSTGEVIECIVDDVTFLEAKKQAEEAPQAEEVKAEAVEIKDEDTPF